MRLLGAMACASALFLVKPHYWPLIVFVWVWTLFIVPKPHWLSYTLGLVPYVLPALFFCWDARHGKILEYVPLVGGHSYVALQGDALYQQSDYVGPGLVGAGALLVKRYAVWALLLNVLGARLWWRGLAAPAGTGLLLALFAWGTAWQFVTVGPYLKQAYAYVGALAPLLAIVLGVWTVKAWR